METPNQTQPIRPLSLNYADAKNDFFLAINRILLQYSIPMFVMESLLSDALYQAKEKAKIEMQNEEAAYQRQMAEYAKNKK